MTIDCGSCERTVVPWGTWSAPFNVLLSSINATSSLYTCRCIALAMDVCAYYMDQSSE